MKIKLSIEKPCHENWDKMSPTEKGRFCNNCNKEVLNLLNTEITDAAEIIHANQKKNVCVRIPSDYLEKPIQLHAAGLNLGKVGSFGAMITAIAFSPIIMPQEESNIEFEGKNILQIQNENEPIKLAGTVVSKENNSLANVQIIVQQGNVKAVGFTDSLGKFGMKLDPMKFTNGEAILIISKQNFKTIEKTIVIFENNFNGNIILSSVESKNSNLSLSMNQNIDTTDVILENDLPAIEIYSEAGEVTRTVCYFMMGSVSYCSFENDMEMVDSNFVGNFPKVEEFIFEEEVVLPNVLKTYPNPATDIVNLEMTKEGNYTVYIFAMDGKMIFNENLNSNKMTIDLSTYERGNYIVKVIDTKTNESFDSKVILMR